MLDGTSRSPEAKVQSSAKTVARSKTAGPSIRRCASCQGRFRRPRPDPVAIQLPPAYSSPTFMPPVKPILSSTTRSLRWFLRWADQRLRSGLSGRNDSVFPPAARSASRLSSGMSDEPTAS